MLIRAVILAIAAWLALSGGLAQAKASPSLNGKRQFDQQFLENQIRDSSERGYCEAGTTSAVEQGIRWISQMSRADGADQTCVKPLPDRVPFEHIVRM